MFKRRLCRPASKNKFSVHEELEQRTMLTGCCRIYFEAEAPSRIAADAETGVSWEVVTNENESQGTPFFQNFLGEGYLQLLPDTEAFFEAEPGGQTPYAEYDFEITDPGAYQLFARWDGFSATSDSFYVSIPELRDGLGGQADWYRYAWNGNDQDFATDRAWHGLAGFERLDAGGSDQATVFEFPRPGRYTLRVDAREDGVAIDSFVLWNMSLPTPVVLAMPEAPVFVGSYVEVPVLIRPDSGLSIEDIEFSVSGAPDSGLISMSERGDGDSGTPHVTLLVGHELGQFELEATERATGTLLGAAAFEATTSWPDSQDGPSQWVTGDYELRGIPGAAWGGGSTTSPENFNVMPAVGTHDVAIVLLDTSSQRFASAEVSTVRDNWRELAFDGRIVDGRQVSTAQYFREASRFDGTVNPPRGFDLRGDVFGPFELTGAWGDYFDDRGIYKSNIWQACATAADAQVDFSTYEHLVCVLQTVDGPPARGVWPHADTMIADVAEGKIPLGTVVMPADGTHMGLSSTLAHELGHNLGLGDIYAWGGHTQQVQDRQLHGMALMANQPDFPHPVLVHKMRLGWIPQNEIKLYNFQAIGGFVDETVTLQATSLPNSAEGYSGIEVRVAPGFNYYFEYRAAQDGQVGEQRLWWPTGDASANERVLSTDAVFGERLENATRRKPVMVLRNDDDGDGPILAAGDDYSERDTSDPAFPTDFTITVLSTDGNKADVRIQYGVTSQPDPSIRPWNPPVYQSPDIEVRNARNQADPKWFNVPWVNRMNTVVAKVTNRGDLNAPRVKVDFYVKDYTVNSSGSHRMWIGSDTQDVVAGQTREFTTTWRPAKEGHYCIEAEIGLYQTPGPNSVVEATQFNNIAQSNYDRFISTTASAPSRETASFDVTNPYDEPIRAAIQVAKNSSPLYRTFIENRWLSLDPGETKTVELMFEFAFEEVPTIDPYEQYIGLPNDVSVVATILEPNGHPEQDPIILGGLNAQIVTGRATEFSNVYVDPAGSGGVVGGQVVTVDNRSHVSGGSAIVSVVQENGELADFVGPVASDGSFQVAVEGSPLRVYYAPLEGFGDAEYVIKTLPTPGDADRNGRVDFADFLILSANFGSSDARWEDGDFDGDQEVSFADFLLLSSNFGLEQAILAEIASTRGHLPAIPLT